MSEKLNDFLPTVKAIYLTSFRGFDKYCKGCQNLVRSEKVQSHLVPMRVQCSVEHCDSARVGE